MIPKNKRTEVYEYLDRYYGRDYWRQTIQEKTGVSAATMTGIIQVKSNNKAVLDAISNMYKKAMEEEDSL